MVNDLRSVTLDRVGLTIVLHRLARKKKEDTRASHLYTKLMGSWGHRPDRERMCVKLGEEDWHQLHSLKLPKGVLGSDVLQSGYVVIYQHPQNKELEVTVHSRAKPPKRRSFVIGGKRRRLVAVHATKIRRNNPKEAKVAKAATKSRKKAKPVEEDVDELEGLEDLDDLEDLEDEEEEEPEDLEDEDEEDEEEEPAPKKARRGKAKKAAPAKRSRKAKVEDEDEDEDEEEEEPPKRTKRGSAKTTAKGKASSKKGNGNLPTQRALPSGHIGPRDIADLVGGDCDDRYVRIYLRENYDRPDGGRWHFTKTEAKGIVRDIKAARKKAGVA